MALQIHPQISAQGEPVTALNYSADHWDKQVNNLEKIVAEESLTLAKMSLIANSLDAPLLAEAGKSLGR